MKIKKAFINGKIYTVNKSNPWAEAILVNMNKIIALGKTSEIERLISDDTEVIDLKGKLMMPGFIDCHTHLILAGVYLSSVQLDQVKSKEEFSSSVKNFVTKNKTQWITGGNWNHHNWGGELPTKEWVDEFTQDTPILLHRMDYHMALANSYALRLANISKNTLNLDGGEIVRDGKGEPTGLLKDKAMDLVQNVIPKPKQEYFNDKIKIALDETKRFGVTSIHDICYQNHFRALQNYYTDNGLTCRINGIIPIENCEELIKAEIRSGLGNDKIKIGALKAFADGSLGSATALFFEPYSDDSNAFGLAMEIISSGKLFKWAKISDENKMQLAIHAIGDKANSLVLDIYQEIIKENPKWDRRFRIEHGQHIAKGDFERFVKQNVIVSVQPEHLTDDGVWAESKIGADRMKRTYAFKSFIDAGVKVCFGTDFPVVSINPMNGIYEAITRKTADGKIVNPEQKLTLEQAIECYTINGAYAEFAEKEKGSIEVGKLADFVVLDKNLFEIPTEEIKDVKVEMTVMDGEIIFEG